MPLEMFEVHTFRQELTCDECGGPMKCTYGGMTVAGPLARTRYEYECTKCKAHQVKPDKYPQTIYVRKRDG